MFLFFYDPQNKVKPPGSTGCAAVGGGRPSAPLCDRVTVGA
jgi:hypothetical protein